MENSKEHSSPRPKGSHILPPDTLIVNTAGPLWRRPLVGYLCVLPMLCLIWLSTQVIHLTLDAVTVSSAAWFLLLAITAFLWGIGPTLLLFILGLFVLDVFFLPPIYRLSLLSWPDVLHLLALAIAGIAVIWIILQVERNRRQSQRAAQRATVYADQLQTVIEQHEQTNQQLADANQTKDRFLSVVSHELKTPVTSISMYAQLLRRRIQKRQIQMSGEEQVTSTLQRIEDQTSNMTEMINALLDIGRMNAGQMPLQKQRWDLVSWCQSAVEEQRMVTGRQIDLHLPSIPIEIVADRNLLTQVLTNLIGNAIKYSPPDTPVQVTLSQVKDLARIEVRDYGQGIAPEHLLHVFDLFYRAPDAQSSGASGLGLGLSIVKRIVEQHDGQIWCQSQPGQGSTFIVELPLYSHEQNQQS